MNSKTISAKFKMIEDGIVPAFTGYELEKMLLSLPYKDRVKAKRKFRKIWKKILKKNPDLKDLFLPEDSDNPTKSNKRNRSVYVVTNYIKST